MRTFESDVISDGTQTSMSRCGSGGVFESDVISDGTQTSRHVGGVKDDV